MAEVHKRGSANGRDLEGDRGGFREAELEEAAREVCPVAMDELDRQLRLTHPCDGYRLDLDVRHSSST